MNFVITCQPGLSHFLERELQSLEIRADADGGAAVLLDGSMRDALSVCMYSRLAERVLVPLGEASGAPREAAARLGRELDWAGHCALAQQLCLRVDHAPGVQGDTRDTARAMLAERPAECPELSRAPRDSLSLRIMAHEDHSRLYVDLAGESLQKRGYRLAGGEAPLRETLAAAMLHAAGWARAESPVLVDPFCGSGTLVVEAAAMARGIAPGLSRSHHGFRHWSGCPGGLWDQLLEQARQAVRPAPEGLSIKGFDADARALANAWANAERAGVADLIHFEKRELGALRPRDFGAGQGLVVTNPPWGDRLDDRFRAAWLHAGLGRVLAERAPGWQALLIGSEAEVMDRTGMRQLEQWRVRNGPTQVLLRRLEPVRSPPQSPLVVSGEPAFEVSEEAVPFLNRLRKNGRHLRRWVEREQIQVWRLYDRDLPEFNLAVDVYGDRVLVQEFAAPGSVDPKDAERRRKAALSAVRSALGVHREQVFVRMRHRQRKGMQYGKLDNTGQYHVVVEGDVRLLVNLHDYLDTGLFADHRPMRLRLANEAAGKRFLNLFGYTGAATVHAAVAGARSSVTVDASASYLQWAAGNLALNGFSTLSHRLEQADVMSWLEQTREQFDLVFCDPPTFSNSKDREDFSVQRDHGELVRRIMKRVEPGGTLYFSCNFRRFVLDEQIRRWFHVEDLSRWSIPPDFQRNERIHHCFRITHAD